MPSTPTNPHAHRHPSDHAQAIAEAVATRWHRADHSGRRDVVLSVVAALALATPRDPHGPDLAAQLRAQSAEEFTSTLRGIYASLINARPDVTHTVYPLMAWAFNDPEPALQHAARAVAEAALREGQLDLTGTDKRHDTDLFGMVLSLLKSRTATSANAQIYTATPVANLMARMSVPEEGSSVCDPAVGTGGLFRATAQAMREHGRDPATVAWYGADIDELAIAACAINSLLWGLGPHLLLYVGNSLSQADWTHRAEAQRAELVRLSQALRRDKLMLHALHTALHLTERVAGTEGDDQYGNSE